MEQWEALLEACPAIPDLRFFSKAIQTAGVVLKEDLAPFEKEWIIQTVLHKPINALDYVSAKRTDVTWTKAITDTYKLLGDVVTEHTDNCEKYFEEIVDLCHLNSLDATSRKQALDCLSRVARVSAAGARDATRLVANLEEVPTGKAALAELVGTICEHHPETVADDANKIWRIYLNLLDSNKNTDKITSSLLQGILGLFRHFGTDLPLAELSPFYDKMVGNYIGISKCEDVCHKILTNHASLFRERISKDMRARNILWNSLHSDNKPNVVPAIRSVYQALCGVIDKAEAQKIVTSELLPQAHSSRIQVKFTAYRVLYYMKEKFSIDVDFENQIDVQTLEFELREEKVTYDTAEAVSFCIECHLPNSDNLLQTAILFYTNIPAGKRKDIVNGILNAGDELRSGAITFLISESTVDSASLENHSALWKDIFQDGGSGFENKTKYVLEDLISYVVFVVEAFLSDGLEPLPARLTNLLQLTSLALSLHPPSESSGEALAALQPPLLALQCTCVDAAVVGVCAAVGLHVEDAWEFYQNINIDHCKDEALLCASCVALIQAPTGSVDVSSVVKALQIIFSRNDVEPNILTKALATLQLIIVNENDKIDANTLQQIIKEIERIRNNKTLIGKDARVLHRDIVMFLGKYNKKVDINNNNNDNNLIITKLMDTLSLNIQNPEEGVNYKVNLQSILQMALEFEDPRALQTLLAIICANLSTPQESSFRALLPRVCHALCRAHVRGASVDTCAVQAATAMCNNVECVRGVLYCISSDPSPGVRRMLSDALEGMLEGTQDDELAATVAEHAAVMMASAESSTKRGGLNITETLINSLKNKNELTTNILPNILILIAKTYEIDSEATFKIATKHFLENFELFQSEIVEDLTKKLLENLLTSDRQNGGPEIKMADTKVRLFKNISRTVLEFIKAIFDYKQESENKTIEVFFDVFGKENNDFEKSLYVLAGMRKVFDFNAELCRNMLSYKNCLILEKLFCMEICMDDNYFRIEVILTFLEEYSESLLELRYQRTLEFLAEIFKNLTPEYIKELHRGIKSCLSVFTAKKTPVVLLNAYENWSSKIPFTEIKKSIEKELFTPEHAIMTFALKVMTEAVNVTDVTTMATLCSFARSCAKTLLRLFSNGYIVKYLKAKMAYLTDLLTVSVKFLSVEEVKKMVLEGSSLEGLPGEKIGVQFSRFFMHVFFEKFVHKPFILLDGDMQKCSILINDVVKYALKKKCTTNLNETILELINKIWPTYETQTTFDQKYSLLLDLTNFPKKLDAESNPLLWAVGGISSEGSKEEKARFIGVLPGGDAFSAAYRSYASTLPTRLSEMSGRRASLRALLDAVAATGDLTTLDIVMTLAGGDPTKGWWDEAIDSCMATLATQPTLPLYNAVYTRCWEELSMGVTCRVLLPLLRYASSSFCEKFFASKLTNIFKMKEMKTNKYSYSYHKHVVDCTRAFTILQILFEKLPIPSLESPTSPLYTEPPTQSWHAVRLTCKLCGTLRTKIVVPDDATEQFKEDYRKFQCANYNCLSAAICKRRPDDEKFYQVLFSRDVWDRLVDENAEVNVKIQAQWKQRTKRQPVSIEVQSSSVLSHTGTVRSRLFLRTLSENPLMYDLIDDAVEEVQTQDLHLHENELNTHECAGALSALLCYMCQLPHTGWRETLAGGVREGKNNTRKLLAQIICNCKEDLRPLADTFRGALLEFICTTAVERDGKTVLDGLHVDILQTLIYWSDDNPTMSIQLNTSIQHLITTCLEYRSNATIFGSLLDILTKTLSVYAEGVDIPLSLFEGYLSDTQVSKTFQILQRISKSRIYIQALLPTLLDKLEKKQYSQLPSISQLFGLGLAACDQRQQYVIRFRKILDQLRRSNAGDFVKMLFYVQNECPDVCDESHFKAVTDLTPKIVGPEKGKCLQILASFISNNPYNEYVPELYETIDLSDMIVKENWDAFKVIKAGLKQMSEAVRKRLLILAGGYCRHAVVKVRRVACELMVAAFQGLFTRPSDHPRAKKPRIATSTIISTLQSDDVYSKTVLSALAYCALDKDSEISALVQSCLQELLSQDLGVRFTECFLLLIYLPSQNKTQDLTGSVSVLLELLFSGVRSQERFKNLKLRDQPLDLRNPNLGPPKLLTMSRTYIGTFRPTLIGRSKMSTQNNFENTPKIDVQIPIDNILEAFLTFSKETPQMAETFCLQFVQALRSHGFDSGAAIAKALKELLDFGPNELTPFAVSLCRIFIVDVCQIDGIQDIIQKLKLHTNNSDGAAIVNLLFEEIQLRCTDGEQFVLGRTISENNDVFMQEEEFCIEDLTSAFGKLSNWDSLTMRERRSILNTGLPILWTDRDGFKDNIQSFEANDSWFGKLISAFHQQEKDSAMKWVRKLDGWPRRHFAASAITEAIEWQSRINTDGVVFPTDIQPDDCLVEWAGRFMIRSAYLDSLPTESSQTNIILSRSHELRWCERANEMQLCSSVLDCVKRNVADLQEGETLAWLRQKILALHHMGIQKNDSEILKKALLTAETHSPAFIQTSSCDVVVDVNRIMLMLHRDLNSLSTGKIQEIFKNVESYSKEGHGTEIMKSKESMKKICEVAITYFDHLWGNNTDLDQNATFAEMLDVLGRTEALGIRNEGILAIVLNTLDNFTAELKGSLGQKLLDMIQNRLTTTDEFSLNQLKSHAHLFPSRSIAKYSFLKERDDGILVKYKRCFQLVSDAEYSLLQYCDLLMKALVKDDAADWKSVFDRMKHKMFENPYAGTDYQLLNKYKSKLYEIYAFEPTPSFRSKSEKALKEIFQQLRRRDPRVLRLSQLCPALSRCEDCPGKLLGLRDNVTVVKFEEQVEVFSNSIRRPTVIKALLSNGLTKRYLHKSGESLVVDAAVQRVVKYAGAMWGERDGYNVTPLSEDCGLIEYLEDHEMIRDLIAESCNLDVASSKVRRPKDQELIWTPTQALTSQFKQLCNAVPSYSLRDAIAKRSVDIRDFVCKIKRFRSTVGSSTMICWVLGVGDRHLQNILYSTQNGGLCHIDWGAVFQYGGSELPPARLTRNILAVCVHTELEARLQQLLSILRANHKLVSAIIKISFKWMDGFKDKYSHITSLLEGKARSNDVTHDVIQSSGQREMEKSKYAELLENVFEEYETKDVYSVEDQISCLLRQCTDPQILSVTRSGWEPWV